MHRRREHPSRATVAKPVRLLHLCQLRITQARAALDAAAILREYHSRPSAYGAAGYANPAFDALVERIEAETVTYTRDALIEETWRILLDDVVVVPLFRPMIVWALRESLELPISPSGVAFFREARVKDPSADLSR